MIFTSARRGFNRLPLLLAAVLLCALFPGAAQAQDHAHHGHAPAAKGHHPAPRPGITGARVLSPDSVRESAREAYTIAARIPSILDGLFCHCDCHEVRGRRSLLECFEDRMAANCGVCSGEARHADMMVRQGKSLDEIRTAIDATFDG